MISCANLGWIIPLCCFIGYVLLSFVLGATVNSREQKAYQHGYIIGYQEAMEVQHKKGKPNE